MATEIFASSKAQTFERYWGIS